MKHEHVEALKMLVGVISDAELVNQKDDNGNTILHLSGAMKHSSLDSLQTMSRFSLLF